MLWFSSGHTGREHLPGPFPSTKDDATDTGLMECDGIDADRFHLKKKSPSNNPSLLPGQKRHSKIEEAWVPESPLRGQLPSQHRMKNIYSEVNVEEMSFAKSLRFVVLVTVARVNRSD